MSLAFSALVRRQLGVTSSARNVFASALLAFCGGGMMLAVALQSLPAGAQTIGEANVAAASQPASPRLDGKPGDLSEMLTVMVELVDKPAALVYADSLKASVQQAGVSFSDMSQPARDAAISTAVSASKAQVSKIESAQQAALPALTSIAYGGKILFRTKSAYNGVSLHATRGQLGALLKIQGVKDVHIQVPKYQTAATDIDFLGARSAWVKTTPNTPYGVHGEGMKIAVIDTGLDYIHTNFGGPGTPAAYASVSDTSAVPNPYFPTFKIPGGYDFAGNAYDANQAPGTGHDPAPDPNPLDSNGHGTGSASLASGLGVTATGATFAGVYDNSTDIAGLKISPGFAPKAFLYPIRVFGTTGSTNLVVQAIDWAIDPNGDGNIADHMDVISMSLGADNGYATDPDAVAASNAAATGAIVASAAGNAADTYYIVSSPSVGPHTLSVAATFNNTGGYFFDSNTTANAPPALAGQKYNSIYGSPSPHVGAGGLTADVVYADPPTGSADGVSPLLNAASMPGKICLIDRGVIGFANKVRLCQDAGAAATIVVQSAAGSGSPNPITMALSGPPTSSIPAVMIGLNEGNLIKAQLDPITRTGVNMTINNDNGFVNQASTAADTMPTYSSRGPTQVASVLKPDISAPAEVVGVAANGTGSNVASFNGTSSATPHVAGIMALLRQLHPAWTVEELMALAMNTATHDENVGPSTGGGAQWGVSRVGAGRVDVTNASKANVVAYNQSDPGLVSMSFGIVEVPVASSVTLNKTLAVVNKGLVSVTYNVTYVDATPVAGATFTVGTGAPVTVPAGGTMTIPVTFAAIGNQLKHVREAALTVNLPSARHWLTEKTGYAVLTPTAGTEPTLRVALHAAPKPVGSMHATAAVPAGGGVFNVGLAGSEINTGASFGTANQDIVGLVKPFELQYKSPLINAPAPPTDPNVIKYVGVTSDFIERGASPANTVLTFLLQGFGNATMPSFLSSDKEIFFSLDGVNFAYAVFLSASANGTATSNAYFPVIVNLGTNGASSRFRTNGLSPATRDTNAFNNSMVSIPILATDIGLLTGGPNIKKFFYEVVTFDRNNNQVDDSGLLTYDMSNPGVDAQGGNLDPFWYNDVAATTIPVTFNGANLLANASLGMILAHMHNATGAQTDVVSFAAAVLQSAVSRKVHGAAGTFDLPLTLTPVTDPTTEPRQGPAQTIVFTFDKPITAATATVTEGTAIAAAPTFSGNDVIVNLTGVNNIQYVTVTLSNVSSADGGSGGTGAVRVGYLAADVNQNRVVTVADVGLVNAALAQTVTAANYLKDINASGTLTVADKAIANAAQATSLPAP